MPIEFECSGCGQMLRVPETAAGKQAKCPSCDLVLGVPSASPPMAPSEEPTQPENANPYAPPHAHSDGTMGSSQQPLIDGRLDPSLSLTIAWQRFKVHFGVLIAAGLAQILIQGAFGGISGLMQNLLGQSPIALIGIGFMISLISTSIAVFLQMGVIALNLAVCRGQPAEFGLLFSQSRSFGPAFLINVVILIFTTIAFQIGPLLGGIVAFILGLLYVIAMIYLTLTYWPVYHLLVDREVSVGEALALASKYTTGNKWPTVMLFIISMGVMILGFVALCIGVFVAAPVISLMYTVGYLMMTSQPIHGYN